MILLKRRSYKLFNMTAYRYFSKHYSVWYWEWFWKSGYIWRI